MITNEEIKNKMEDLIKSNYQMFEKFNLALEGRGDFSDLVNINSNFKSPFYFESDLGKIFEEKLNKIMMFWLKMNFPQVSFDMVGLTFKMLINAFVGDNIFNLLRDIWKSLTKNNQTENSEALSDLYKLSDEDHDLIGTMTIVLFSGIIEDFVNNLKEDSIKKFTINISNREYQKSTILKRLRLLFYKLNFFELSFNDDTLEMLFSLSNELDDFRKLRNMIAHQGIQEMFLAMKDQVLKLSLYIGSLLEPQMNNQFKLVAQKEGFLLIMKKFLPLLCYIFILYYKFLPPLNIFDYYYNLKILQQMSYKN